MSTTHIFQIETLKSHFDDIIVMKKDVRYMMASMRQKLTELKNLHNQLIKTNCKHIFLFCLDSFFYQYKLFSLELENIEKMSSLFNNRMYCDYYKLHNIIIKYIKEYKKEATDDFVEDTIDFKNFPVYKDLEPFQQYDIEDIRAVHNNILQCVNYLHKCYLNKSDSITNYNQHHRVGFSISNFINTLNHENRILQEQIVLYVNYISFFHISQKRQLSRLYTRLDDFSREVDTNINVNHAFSIEDIIDEHNEKLVYENIAAKHHESAPAPAPAPVHVHESTPAPAPAPVHVHESTPAPAPAPVHVPESTPAPAPAPAQVQESVPIQVHEHTSVQVQFPETEQEPIPAPAPPSTPEQTQGSQVSPPEPQPIDNIKTDSENLASIPVEEIHHTFTETTIEDLPKFTPLTFVSDVADEATPTNT